MKRRQFLLLSALASGVSAVNPAWAQFNLGRMLDAGKTLVQAETLSDADLKAYFDQMAVRELKAVRIDEIEVGQKAAVRLTSLNQRTTPVLQGHLVYVSADALATQTDGIQREGYVVRIDLPPSELGRVHGFRPTPGMPAEVMIETSARTFAQYLVKPIEDSLSRAFREN